MSSTTENVTSPQQSLQSSSCTSPRGDIRGQRLSPHCLFLGSPSHPFPQTAFPTLFHRCTTTAQGRLLHHCPAVGPSEAFHPGGLAHGPSLHPHVPAEGRRPFGAAALDVCVNQSAVLDGAALGTSSKPGPLPKHKADLKFLTLRSGQTRRRVLWGAEPGSRGLSGGSGRTWLRREGKKSGTQGSASPAVSLSVLYCNISLLLLIFMPN